MRMRSAIGIAAVAAASLVALAPAATAYDADRYSYAAGHMIQPSDIPASLQIKPGMNFNANPNSDKVWLCSKDSSWLGYPGGTDAYNANYYGKKKNSETVTLTQSVMQYDSFTDAQKAFSSLTKQLKKCDGKASGTDIFEDGSSLQWSRLTTSGSVPLVTVVGVESQSLNVNYTSSNTTSSGDSVDNSDNYQVYTLVNDVIITTSYYNGDTLNIDSGTRKQINQVAFNAVSRWLD